MRIQKTERRRRTRPHPPRRLFLPTSDKTCLIIPSSASACLASASTPSTSLMNYFYGKNQIKNMLVNQSVTYVGELNPDSLYRLRLYSRTGGARKSLRFMLANKNEIAASYFGRILRPTESDLTPILEEGVAGVG